MIIDTESAHRREREKEREEDVCIAQNKTFFVCLYKLYDLFSFDAVLVFILYILASVCLGRQRRLGHGSQSVVELQRRLWL